MSRADLYLKKRANEYSYTPDLLDSLKRREERARLEMMRNIAHEAGIAQKYPGERQERWRTRTARKMFEMMPGKTEQQKREQFQKLTGQKTEMLDFLGIHIQRVRGGSRMNDKLKSPFRGAGIEKLLPMEQETIEMISKGMPICEKSESSGLYCANLRILRWLEEAEILKRKKQAKSNKITDYEILDRKRLDETMRTGYIQWPEPEPLIKYRGTEEKR